MNNLVLCVLCCALLCYAALCRAVLSHRMGRFSVVCASCVVVYRLDQVNRSISQSVAAAVIDPDSGFRSA